MRVAVFASSSDQVGEPYRTAARTLGQELGSRGVGLVYGGTPLGLMGELAAGSRAAGGHVTGVLPERMRDEGLADEACDELLVTTSMSDRKREMYSRADAFVALPGGFGTLEELLEVLTLRQLGYHAKPIVLLDVAGFWEPLLAVFERMFEQGFARREYARHWRLAVDVDGAMAALGVARGA